MSQLCLLDMRPARCTAALLEWLCVRAHYYLTVQTVGEVIFSLGKPASLKGAVITLLILYFTLTGNVPFDRTGDCYHWRYGRHLSA